MRDLRPTATQAAIFNYILASTRANLYQPTNAEVAREFGFSSPASVSQILRALQTKGYILPNLSRSRAILFVRREAFIPSEFKPEKETEHADV